MSLLWPDTDAQIVLDEARLHALIIGVGHYPHLNGGEGPFANDPLGLSQVTTAPLTAATIAKWLLDGYASTECPIGSVEVLISPDQAMRRSDTRVKRFERALFSAVEAAANQWKRRCSANRKNKAFFYFCGHGLNKGSQYILPEDFGDPQWDDPWRNNIDFDGMRVGMRACKAQTQLYFVDACRETPFGMLDQINVSGQSLIGGATFSDAVECTAAYYATTEGKQAFGPQNDVSYFGQALLKCLDGAGSSNATGDWIVDTYSLSRALGDLMRHLGRKHNLDLRCNPNVSGMGIIHQPTKAYVIARIACTNKPEMDSEAEIVMRRGSDARHSKVGHQKPLIEEVPPGDWDIQIAFPGRNGLRPFRKIYPLMPPIFEGVPIP
jgi:Caspase domain